jgi:UvrD-like helicase family protein
MKWISTVAVEANGIRVGDQTWEWYAVDDVSRTDFLVASRLTLRLLDGTRTAAWGATSAARALQHSVEEALTSWASASKARLLEVSHTFQNFLDSDRYLSERLVASFQAANPALPELVRVAHRLARRGDAEAARFAELATDVPATIARRNQAWSAEEQERWRQLFDVVEATPLTPEQRKAVVDFESRNLLVAAAGSGKSSTLVAKIAYAVRKGLVRPEEVLALAFNRRAATELKDRIAARLADYEGSASIRSETFHGLGYRILAQERRPTIEDDRDKLIADVCERLRVTDASFRREVVRFILKFTPELRDQTEFSSYEEYLLYVREQESGTGRNGRRVATLSGHHVASLEEMKIANWLFTHGVTFEYEKTYPHAEATQERRGYTRTSTTQTSTCGTSTLASTPLAGRRGSSGTRTRTSRGCGGSESATPRSAHDSSRPRAPCSPTGASSTRSSASYGPMVSRSRSCRRVRWTPSSARRHTATSPRC